jgi:hypothetical protein
VTSHECPRRCGACRSSLGDQVRRRLDPPPGIPRCNVFTVAVREDVPCNIKPDKERSSERTDGIAALVNALGCALLRDANAGRSVGGDAAQRMPAERNKYLPADARDAAVSKGGCC